MSKTKSRLLSNNGDLLSTEDNKKDLQEILGEYADPRPSALIESLRAFGYDLKTSIADLIDNSISAHAKNIYVDFYYNGFDSSVTITDDGIGMTLEGLVNAMRPGSFSPLEVRKPEDLGRFGLGLKTASFSQCRRTTVFSKIEGSTGNARTWDLDTVIAGNKWQLIIPNSSGEIREFSRIRNFNSGTVVLWEKTDRISSGMETECANDLNRFNDMIDEVSEHLSMTFHRFLEGHGKINIFINGNPVEPWDPFLSSHPSTQEITDEPIPLSKEIVNITPYVLPHHSRITDEEHERSSGPKGWNDQQGFYIYRNRRLLVSGSWLNLGFKKEEHYKLARIKVDIPNSLDSQWQIDVKKAVARPPPQIRDDLKRLARLTRKRASDIYRHRGKIIARTQSGNDTFMWEIITKNRKPTYKINRKHPLVSDLLNDDSVNHTKIRQLLKGIEETVPISAIILKNSENPDSISAPFEHSSEDEIYGYIDVFYLALKKRGFTDSAILEKLRFHEEFRDYQDLIDIYFEKRRKNE
ncbi:ATP-binding protein [Methanofollis aquaemaris]|uniref:ATP-binding protein n=1 Tax=Methanofollis aquaemaris TaxID=126734 RepID=A0A8A3S465_9EURY|nr:ATP-binding protein [Methanofollis aquaemaris]